MAAGASRHFVLTGRLVLVALALWAAAAASHDEPSQQIAALSAGGRLRAVEYLRRGELHRITEQWALAAADYDSAGRNGAHEADLAACRSALAIDRGHPDEALVRLRPVLDRFPRHERAIALEADALEALGRRREALAQLDRLLAITARPTPDLYLRRARLVSSLGPRQAGRALRGLDRGVARLGPLVSLESEAIRIELARGRPDQALWRLDRIAPLLALHEALERRGVILAAAGREAEARAAFAAALAEIESLTPSRPSADLARRSARLRAALEHGFAPDGAYPLEPIEP